MNAWSGALLGYGAIGLEYIIRLNVMVKRVREGAVQNVNCRWVVNFVAIPDSNVGQSDA
jgi:hypothetical protein